MNRVLGLNLQQQQIVFGCAHTPRTFASRWGVPIACARSRRRLPSALRTGSDSRARARRRYFQRLLDTQIDIAKAKGSFNAGVRFMNGDVECTSSQVIWRHPLPGHGEARA